MARWQCELRVSLRTRWFSLLIYVGLACLILFTPWPTGGAVVCFLLLMLITFEYFQRQIKYWPTVIKLNTDNVLEWNQQQWNIIQPPWITRYGVLLALKQQANHKIYQRLWLASDSMTEREWRMFCQLMRGLGDCE
ncbi:protein YgfX [Candidatus Regiella insecticola]|uniref:Inner membrane protein YgfX n=1 Tax=Candidatus Regiella insecticola TaxID=138073 RepID=A0A6L2ZPU8_9ENTR|nr:protein YgfX [Candidatus Regiella insecticola]GFN46572.1 inner membrane protein YgfX [Candidatus Regiella insecticola]